LLQYVSAQDLKSYGLIPELVGRLPVLAHLDPLDEQALRNILTEPRNSIIKQYIKLFAMENVKLHFEEDALAFIVEKAMAFNLGARGLRSICEAIMLEPMFDIPSANDKVKELTVDRAFVETQFEKSADAKKLRVA
jgi:ATP-dependent Clp protease ATP-binding subunit ClpX